MSKDVVWDASDFLRGLTRYEKVAVEGAGQRQLYLNGLDLEKWAKLLEPLDEGTLTGSTITVQVLSANEVLVGANVPYAAKVHYEMDPAPGATMKPGPRTQAKPSTKFGPAGGLYLTRPLQGNKKKYVKAVARAMRSAK